MRVLMRKDPDFAGPKATAIPMALPLREKGHDWKYFLKSVQKVSLLYHRVVPRWQATQPNVMYLEAFSLCTGTNTCHRRHLAAITSLPSSWTNIDLAIV